jgi:AbrB family looped-hinge helix DNA binding protein
MSEVTLSSKFQIVIPADVRRALGLQPGQRLEVLRLGQRIELVPVRPMREGRGFLEGIDPSVEREPDRT